MPFDLKAAHKAAQTEAQAAPFEFSWGDEVFSLAPMGSWPLSISATLAGYAEAKPEDIDPQDVILCLRQIIGETDWTRFSQTVPIDALPVLIEAMSKDQVGGSMPDLSEPPERDSIPT